MTAHLQLQTRQHATIAGYRRICDDLEAENDALRLELQALRAELARRADAPFAGRSEFPDFGAIALAQRKSAASRRSATPAMANAWAQIGVS